MAAWVSTQAKSVIFFYLFVFCILFATQINLHDNKKCRNNGEEAKRNLIAYVKSVRPP